MRQVIAEECEYKDLVECVIHLPKLKKLYCDLDLEMEKLLGY